MNKWICGVSLALSAALTVACGGPNPDGGPEGEGAAPQEAVREGAEALGVGPVAVSYNRPVSLIASTGNLYWTSYAIDEFGPDSATVYRAGKDNKPGSEIVLYRESGDTNGFYHFGSLVYANVGGAWYGYFLAHYEDFSAGTSTSYIKRVPLTGGSATILATSPAYARGKDLVTDGSYLYWADRGGLRRAPIGGGAPTTLVAGTNIGRIGLDAGFVYYGDGSAIRKVPKAGGAITSIAMAGGDVTALHIQVGGPTTVLYWGESRGAVRSQVAIPNQAATTYWDGSVGRIATSVGFDGTRVLWSDCSTAGNACNVRKKQSGTVTTIASGLVGANNLQWDASHLFWGDNYLEKYTY